MLASNIEEALNSAAMFGPGSVAVSAQPGTNNVINISFRGKLENANVSQLVPSITLITPPATTLAQFVTPATVFEGTGNELQTLTFGARQGTNERQTIARVGTATPTVNFNFNGVNSANIQLLREQKGDLKAAAAELKKRQLMLVDAELQAKAAAGAAKDPSVAQAIEAYKSSSAAKQAEWDAEQRRALERTVTKQLQRTTTPVHLAPNAAKPPEERNDQQARAMAAQDSIDAFGTAAGLQRDAKGNWVVGKGPLPPAFAEGVKGFFGADTPVNDALRAAAQAYGRFQSGGVIGPDEEVEFRRMLGEDTLTRAQLASRLNALQPTLNSRLRSTDEAAREQRVAIPYQRLR